MIERSIYLDREDAYSVEEEERNMFLRSVLEEVGVPLEDVWPDICLTVDQKIKMRGLLGKLDIEIVDDGDRGYQVWHEKTKLAEWFKPRFILREDMEARTFTKRLYYEMVIKTWSVYDNQEEDDDEGNRN
jgi:hypothetical protein